MIRVAWFAFGICLGAALFLLLTNGAAAQQSAVATIVVAGWVHVRRRPRRVLR